MENDPTVKVRNLKTREEKTGNPAGVAELLGK